MTLVIVHPNYPPFGTMTPRATSDITDLIIHHSDGPLDQTPLDIDQEHRNEGWAGIGYNYVITPDGTIYKGRPDDVIPSAAYGRNEQSVNVCLIGGFEPGPGCTGVPTSSQLNSLKSLIVSLHKTYPSIVHTIGHRDVATMFYPNDTANYATACPGQRLYDLLPSLRAFARDQLSG